MAHDWQGFTHRGRYWQSDSFPCCTPFWQLHWSQWGPMRWTVRERVMSEGDWPRPHAPPTWYSSSKPLSLLWWRSFTCWEKRDLGIGFMRSATSPPDKGLVEGWRGGEERREGRRREGGEKEDGRREGRGQGGKQKSPMTAPNTCYQCSL